MYYIKLNIAIEDDYQETLIAELMDMEFDSFQQLDDELITYIPKERFHVGDRERIEHLLAAFPGDGYLKSEEVAVDQNWNEEWEQTIQPQAIGPFLVRPTWSTEEAGPQQILLEIDPKMAFGTGYHETTRLMLQRLPEIIEEDDRVLDAGTGTGILAIAALKLGAGQVIAFDIDEWSITNARENVHLNEVADKITIMQGTHTVVEEDATFDIILANIQRNVITEMMPFLADKLNNGGRLLLSGLQEDDEQIMEESLRENGLYIKSTSQENEWIAVEAG
jgi:ribosomal protein L11 methyltransferase